jgi:hypothetical protein
MKELPIQPASGKPVETIGSELVRSDYATALDITIRGTAPTGAGQSGGPQFREARDRLVQIVLDGLRHGHFRCSISSGIGKGNRRELVIEAGKSHKFTIPEEELPR